MVWRILWHLAKLELFLLTASHMFCVLVHLRENSTLVTSHFKGSFGGAPIIANINGRRHEIRLCGPPPEVKIEQDPSYDLIRFMNEMRRQQQLQQQQSDFKVKEEKKGMIFNNMKKNGLCIEKFSNIFYYSNFFR